MSYSDYGGYAWRNSERFTPAEDGTLLGIYAPSVEERPLEEITGLKLDVLQHAYEVQGMKYGEEPEVDWLTGHPHHVVFGGMKGVGLVGHKQSVIIVLDGKKIQEYPPDSWDYKTPLARFDHKISGCRVVLEHTVYPYSRGCMLYMEHSPGVIYSGVCGYGVGDHWWKDDQGREYDEDGNVNETSRLWPTFPQWEARIQKWITSISR